MAVNKVAFFGNTIMDISDTTADESSVVAGKQFYKANGARATGTADYQPKITTQTVSLSGSWIGRGPVLSNDTYGPSRRSPSQPQSHY